MKVLPVGWNTFNETHKYTCATVEYTGLVSFSYLKRAGGVLKAGMRKATLPVTTAVSWPFAVIRDKTVSIFSSKAHEERIKNLEEKVAAFEQRLGTMEKYGVLPGPRAAARKKKIDESKRQVLQTILEDTKSLRETE